nr:MAG TPA: hypothetical protein [Caudoviricetes sp.]
MALTGRVIVLFISDKQYTMVCNESIFGFLRADSYCSNGTNKAVLLAILRF